MRKTKTGILKSEMAIQWKLAKKHRTQYLFVLPYFAVFFTFTILPIILSIVVSFTSFNVLEFPRFIGLQNYFRLFVEDEIFIRSLKNTFVFAVVTGPLGYLISLLMAWIINDRSRGQRVFYTVLFYAPSLTGGLTAIMKIIFSSDRNGFLNAILLNWGILAEPIKYFEDIRYINAIIIFVILWGGMGTQFLSFIAGLQGVDKQFYEAGAIDGIKNRWQELWFITLPMMKPQLMFGAVLSITGSLGVGGVITNLAGFPSKEYVAHTVTLHLSDYGGIRYEMGYASAIAVILFLVMVVCNKAIQKLLSKVGT